MDSDLDFDMKTIISDFKEIINKHKDCGKIDGKALFDDLLKNKAVTHYTIISITLSQIKIETDKIKSLKRIEFGIDQDGTPIIIDVKEFYGVLREFRKWTAKDILDLFRSAIKASYVDHMDNVIEGVGLSSSPLFSFKDCLCLSMVFLRFV